MLPRVIVVGLGPAGPELTTADAAAILAGAAPLYLRTARHPAAEALLSRPPTAGAHSFDDLYESAASFPQLYRDIVESLVEAATRHGQVVYAVPGSPLVAESTVELLRADDRVEAAIHPGLSFIDLAWARLGLDPLAAGVRLVDGEEFAVQAAGGVGPFLVAQCWSKGILSDVKLSMPEPPRARVTVLAHLGLADEEVFDVDWDDLDRSVVPDHLTCLYIPALAAPVGGEMTRLADLVRTLRRSCPWDQAQTHASLTRHLVEETYEVLEAIEDLVVAESTEAYAHLEEELGDVLFQVFFHAGLAAEAGQFDVADVARGVHDKLVHRHPHVFGTVKADSPEAVMANWEQIKKVEKGRQSLMDGIPRALPALLYAHKVQRKAKSVGFDWPDPAGALAKVSEELAELEAEISLQRPDRVAERPDRVAEEAGDLLFSAVNVVRHLGLDPEVVLRGAAAKFAHRFRAMEVLSQVAGVELGDLDLAGLDELWERAKLP
ncbi:MAG: nucleoside triphosphate pyrophosphohydrolase [Acidimicrobiales bacterium]